jgi:hypothetical protein
MGVKYMQVTGKIGADSPAGWIGYVDELHKMAYVKKFQVFASEDYPDQNSTVAAYTDGELPYLEMEVMSPLRQIGPGQSYSFTIDWYACAASGPLTDCTATGVVTQPLKLQKVQGKPDPVLTGRFGVFYKGSARLLFRDKKGAEREYKKVAVTPEKPLEFAEPIHLDGGTQELLLQIVNENGKAFDNDMLAKLKVK